MRASGYLDEVRQASRERLDSYVAQFTAQGNILTHGPAETAILEATKSLPADLVVVGTHGRTGLGRLALGSVAEAVVREAGCSTLVVRLNS
jgi:nucleotide-binding universal stress UspA family protein